MELRYSIYESETSQWMLSDMLNALCNLAILSNYSLGFVGTKSACIEFFLTREEHDAYCQGIEANF